MQVRRYGNALTEGPDRQYWDQGTIGSNFDPGYLGAIKVQEAQLNGQRKADIVFMVAVFIALAAALTYGFFCALTEAQKMLPPLRFH